MARTLNVYLQKNLVGHLIQDDDGQMVFDYAEAWIDNPEAFPLSHSLPLRKERFSRKDCQGFFAGILPEGNKREIIARILGISGKNDYAMIERIGGECAGAVTFVPEGEPFPEFNYGYRKLNETELANILRELPNRPLMAGAEGVRLSLAGAQDKLAVATHGNDISLPLGGAPSSHILKPAIDRFEGLVHNEAVCMKLAKRIGLTTARVTIGNAQGIDYLSVERYDRKTVRAPSPQPPGLASGSSSLGNFEIKRLHQEDFCQALAYPPHKKYQGEGGPSLKQCFDLVRETSSIPAVGLQFFLDAVIFNALIGNNDAHAKNYSLIYDEHPTPDAISLRGRITKFAPLYDLVCTVYYPELSKKMAMKIGGESISEKLVPEHFEKLAEEAGLAKPMVVRRVLALAEKIKMSLAGLEVDHPATQHVTQIIAERCDSFITRFR